ncbi:FimB/Mfa2 family fimbrial subunit [Coprobacter tertius]|uniref:FimB/Mfa2 family fimbrial subunit n=1 Tax=Coprobacter tertius TaxID=2944915 RepID=A0ABT1MHT6_9BACT|nr:FimB/Mfa2 family fimbrial subunit [Coprobacter tertius]MCP9612187.1 FimB/Mfa2 family fimbrial subunit [Coprobacter tertius]
MRVIRYIFLVVLPVMCLFSCSEDTLDGRKPGVSSEIRNKKETVTFINKTNNAIIYAFRKEGEGYWYNSTIGEHWNEGKIKVSMPMGEYKFLFSESSGNNFMLIPETLTPITNYKDVMFVVKPDVLNNGCLMPSGELFLQEYQIADSVYSISSGSTITCTLKRAVSQLRITVKQGYKHGDEYIPVPYEQGHSMADIFENIQVEITGVGKCVNASGTYDTGKSLSTYSIDKNVLTADGFIDIDGPFFLPSSNSERKISLKVSLNPVDGSPFQKMEKLLTGHAERNEQLEIRLWVNSAYKLIGITLDRIPISEKITGDNGMWN